MKLSQGLTIEMFKDYLENRGYSKETIKRYLREILIFFSVLKETKEKIDVREITKNDIIDYQIYLSKAVKEDGEEIRYGFSTQNGMMISLKMFFKFLFRNEYILHNPFDTLNITRVKVSKLRESIPEDLINKFLDNIGLKNAIDIRDRTIFELMYGTGLRVSEVRKLDVTDVDLNTGRLMVREGKGKKDRIVPLGNNVMKYLELFLKNSRNEFLEYVKDNEMRDALFLSYKGRRLGIEAIEERLRKRYKELFPDEKNICPHMIRHSFATHMLDHGAGVKEVKDILGHKCIQSTVRYTHFSVKSLKRILKMYHPRENELYIEFTKEEEKICRFVLTGNQQ